ncbi:hypothetical protein MMC31_006546 [Peltigera leucophlebia]|nr:hypothetical protein [Peltigera leucophlebia]
MVAYMAIANPLPSWDLTQADMPIGIEDKDYINPDQFNVDFWNIESQPYIGSPQNWISQALADGFPKPTRPSQLIPKPAPFSVCKDEAYIGLCCDDRMPASTLQRSDIHEEYSDDQLEAWFWKDSMKGGIAQPCVRSDIFPGANLQYGPESPAGPAGVGNPILIIPQKCALDCDPDSGE